MTETRSATDPRSGALRHNLAVPIQQRALRLAVLKLTGTVLKGTHFFRIKAPLFRACGYSVAKTVRIVGPIHMSTRCGLSIGEESWIGTGLTIHGNGSVVIGSNCDLGPEVACLTGTHSIGTARRRAGKGHSTVVNISDGCWIGARSTLVGTVDIGSGSVVGACSLVIRNLDEDSLAAGIPAREIRTLS